MQKKSWIRVFSQSIAALSELKIQATTWKKSQQIQLILKISSLTGCGKAAFWAAVGKVFL